MWEVREYANGELVNTNAQIVQQTGEAPVVKAHFDDLIGLLDELKTKAPIELMQQYLEGGPVVAGDAVSSWGGNAEAAWSLPEEANRFNAEHHAVRFVDGQGLEWLINDEVQATVWHEPTLALIPLREGIDEIEIRYRSEGSAFWHWKQNRFGDRRFGRSPWHPQLGIVHPRLDLRAFVGANSSAQDGLIAGTRTVLKKNAKATGVLIGKVVNLASKKPRRLERDPLWGKRITEYQINFPGIENTFPNLKYLPAAPTASSAIVVVHGLFSCSIGIARHFEKNPPGEFMYRYEHDTFRNVSENAQELADLVLEKLELRKLLFVAHSRGGLVARMAAAKLEAAGARSDVEVWTYGTPHKGTPIVYAGQRALGALYGLGRVAIGAIPVAWYLHAGMRLLLGRSDLPPGVQDMEPGRSFLETLNLSTRDCTVRSLAGNFDPQTSTSSGYGLIFAKSLGRAAFNGNNDLVVPTDSSAAEGKARQIDDCDHFSYFEKSALQKEIVDWRGQ